MKGYLKKTEAECTYGGAIFVHGRLYDIPDAIKDKFEAPSKPEKKTKPRKEKEDSANLKVVENDG